MSVIEQPVLRNIYDEQSFSDAELIAERRRVTQETAIEREWTARAELEPFGSDDVLECAARNKRLQRVTAGTGFVVIGSLRPAWPDEYSPPYLRPQAHYTLQYIADQWAAQESHSDGADWRLSVTSLVRSTRYQSELLTRKARKIAVDPAQGLHSSHEFGIAFDIDANGLYKERGGKLAPVHPRVEHDHHDKTARSREVLRTVLLDLQEREYLNVVEEVPDTQQWCFHVCANPTISAGSVLSGLRLR